MARLLCHRFLLTIQWRKRSLVGAMKMICLKWQEGVRYKVIITDNNFMENLTDRCFQLSIIINWRNNCTFETGISIERALDYAKAGRDSGRIGACQLRPQNNDYLQWRQYYNYLNFMYCQLNE